MRRRRWSDWRSRKRVAALAASRRLHGHRRGAGLHADASLCDRHAAATARWRLPSPR